MRQHAAHDVETHFLAALANDLTNIFPHRTGQSLVAMFRDPHDVKFVVKSRVLGSSQDSLKRTGWKPVVYLQ